MKDPVGRSKRHTDWQKLFANHVSNKGLVARIYKEHLKTQQLKASNTIRTQAKRQTFCKVKMKYRYIDGKYTQRDIQLISH